MCCRRINDLQVGWNQFRPAMCHTIITQCLYVATSRYVSAHILQVTVKTKQKQTNKRTNPYLIHFVDENSNKSKNSSTCNFTSVSADDIRGVLLERDQLLREKEQLNQFIDQLLQTKDKLLEENSQLNQENSQLNQHKDQLIQEKDKLLEENSQMNQHIDQLIQEKDKLLEENSRLNQGKTKLIQESSHLH